MILRPCKCGHMPTIKRTRTDHIYMIRLECQCGEHGAVLMFTKPEDLPRMEQAAADGWNLAQ